MSADIVIQHEGKNVLLYSDPSNPYESIYIRAKIENGCLTVTDEEIEHGPDGGSSCRILTFDKENTKKVMALLSFGGADPFAALKAMMGYEQRTRVFTDSCTKLGIVFDNSLWF